MSPNKRYIDHLRSKPESTRNALAAVLAIMPALLVGYAQFYMNARASDQKLADTQDQNNIQDVSAIASVGKIFSEGKSSIGSALGDLDKKMTSTKKELESIKQNTSDLSATGSESSTTDSGIINATE